MIGLVVLLTLFPPVPKGENNIHMVYDGATNRLNDSLWFLTFRLLTVWDHIRGVEKTTYMTDVDAEEMFLNLRLYESIQQYCGVNL